MKTLSILIVAGLTTAAKAVEILGNLSSTNDLTQSASLSLVRIKGLGFTMGSSDYLLDNALVRLEFAQRGIDNAFLPILQIRTFGSTGPENVVHTLLAPGGYSVGTGNYVFQADGSFTLRANQTYYLTMSSTSTDPGTGGGELGINWKANDPNPTATGVAAFAPSYFTGDGTTWIPSSIENSVQINGSVVPEPATLAGLVGAVAVYALRRRNGR